tara:strand:+ start:431 stop:757 length:327 start_codon:yes stop_codon:yes gene_type:complete
MNISFEKAAEISGKTLDDFVDWTQSFKPDYVKRTYDDDYDVYVYTDGDCGVAIIEQSEIFEAGIQLRLTEEIKYCDFESSMLIHISCEINRKMNEENRRIDEQNTGLD